MLLSELAKVAMGMRVDICIIAANLLSLQTYLARRAHSRTHPNTFKDLLILYHSNLWSPFSILVFWLMLPSGLAEVAMGMRADICISRGHHNRISNILRTRRWGAKSMLDPRGDLSSIFFLKVMLFQPAKEKSLTFFHPLYYHGRSVSNQVLGEPGFRINFEKNSKKRFWWELQTS